MTIQVSIKNKATAEGHNVEVTEVYESGSTGVTVVLKPQGEYESYVYNGKSFLIKEKFETKTVDTPVQTDDKYV